MSSSFSRPITEIPDLILPDYNVYKFRPDFYKIVRMRSTAPRVHLPRHNDDGYKHKDKLPQALSRARRVVLELALCNDWKWFATFTIAKNNYDRKNLDRFYERFSEWFKYQRKKYGLKLPYLLVPEQHGDGSWHMHGFFNGDLDKLLIPFQEMLDAGEDIPVTLAKKGYFNWREYQEKFGFCSFGKIKNHDAASFYVVKYISKSFQGDARRVGLNLYYCSQGLNRSEHFDSVYGPCPELDQHLSNFYEHCATGFFSFQREPGDDPILDILDLYRVRLCPLILDQDDPAEAEADEFYEVVQLSLFNT